MTREGVDTKIALLRENLQKLTEIPQSSREEFSKDFRNLDSALHRLQTSIQALIDIGSFAVATHGLGTPTSSRDVLDRLESAGHLPAGSTDRFGPIFGFRNRVVHLYDRIDEDIVYRVLTEDRDDLLELAKLLVGALGE